MLDFVALCYEFPPWLLAGAIVNQKLLSHLRDQGWKFEVVTAAPGASLPGVPVHHVPNPGASWWVNALGRLKLTRFRECAVWPDDAIYWNDAAVQFTVDLIRKRRPRLILDFMMPYGAGIAGLQLKKQTGLPLVFCLGDSLSCTDMHPSFPTYLHHRWARQLEDDYVRASDAIVYVSQMNADVVRSRQVPEHQNKVQVVRCGAEPEEFAPLAGVGPDANGPVRIVYIGTMGGWHAWYKRRPLLTWLKESVNDLGRCHVYRLDHATHTPVFVGRAVQQVLAARPDWRGKVFVDVYGGLVATAQQIQKVLEVTGLTDVVRMHGPQPRTEVTRQTRTADLLFQCIQNRTDDTPGGRIAAKTYEYLMTDRPILAAVPRGENWDYYADKPGVRLVLPDDVPGMAAAITEVCAAKLDRRQVLSVDRSSLQAELSYANRSQQLAGVLRQVLAEPVGAGACAK